MGKEGDFVTQSDVYRDLAILYWLAFILVGKIRHQLVRNVSICSRTVLHVVSTIKIFLIFFAMIIIRGNFNHYCNMKLLL